MYSKQVAYETDFSEFTTAEGPSGFKIPIDITVFDKNTVYGIFTDNEQSAIVKRDQSNTMWERITICDGIVQIETFDTDKNPIIRDMAHDVKLFNTKTKRWYILALT